MVFKRHNPGCPCCDNAGIRECATASIPDAGEPGGFRIVDPAIVDIPENISIRSNADPVSITIPSRTSGDPLPVYHPGLAFALRQTLVLDPVNASPDGCNWSTTEVPFSCPELVSVRQAGFPDFFCAGAGYDMQEPGDFTLFSWLQIPSAHAFYTAEMALVWDEGNFQPDCFLYSTPHPSTVDPEVQSNIPSYNGTYEARGNTCVDPTSFKEWREFDADTTFPLARALGTVDIQDQASRPNPDTTLYGPEIDFRIRVRVLQLINSMYTAQRECYFNDPNWEVCGDPLTMGLRSEVGAALIFDLNLSVANLGTHFPLASNWPLSWNDLVNTVFTGATLSEAPVDTINSFDMMAYPCSSKYSLHGTTGAGSWDYLATDVNNLTFELVP